MGRVNRPRLALGATTFALVAVVSYATQRLAAWFAGEPDPTVIIASEHIAYLYRVALCLLHGVVAGTLAGLAFGDETAERWLARGPWLVWLVVVPSAIAMGLVP